jgi:hypothetical protein
MIIAPPTLPYQASGVSFIAGRRLIVATTFETPITLFKATSKSICWSVRNCFCWPSGESVVLSAYADAVIGNAGNPQVPVNLRIGSLTKPTGLVNSDPTATSFGTYIASTKSSSTPTPSGNLLIVIDPGHSLLITATGSMDGVDIGIGYSWYELDP